MGASSTEPGQIRVLRISYGVELSQAVFAPVLRPSWALVKVYSAVWGGVEEAAALGLLWVSPGRVPGMQGYGVVVDLAEGAPRVLSGKRVIISRLPRHDEVREYRDKTWAVVEGIAPPPGTVYDGWLAEYVSLPSSSLEIVETSMEPEYVALATSAAIAWAAARTMLDYGGNKFAIMGSGPIALLASHVLSLQGVRHEVFSRHPLWRDAAKALGVEVKHPKSAIVDTGRGYDAVFLATLDPLDADFAADIVSSDGLLVLHPIYSYMEPPRTRKGYVKILKSFPAQVGIDLVKKIRDVIDSLVEVVEGLETPPIPRPKPFISYRITAP